MDSFSYYSKFEFCKMKVVMCISCNLAFALRYLGGERFQT